MVRNRPQKMQYLNICVVNETKSLEWYIKQQNESLFFAVKINNSIAAENGMHPQTFKKHDDEERINDWKIEITTWAMLRRSRKRRQNRSLEMAKKKWSERMR